MPDRSPATKRFVVRFTGRVQGVGFRATCRLESYGLTINGFVRNERNGSVTMDVDASPADGRELIRRISAARSAHIDNLYSEESESLGRNDGFRIL